MSVFSATFTPDFISSIIGEVTPVLPREVLPSIMDAGRKQLKIADSPDEKIAAVLSKILKEMPLTIEKAKLLYAFQNWTGYRDAGFDVKRDIRAAEEQLMPKPYLNLDQFKLNLWYLYAHLSGDYRESQQLSGGLVQLYKSVESKAEEYTMSSNFGSMDDIRKELLGMIQEAKTKETFESLKIRYVKLQEYVETYLKHVLIMKLAACTRKWCRCLEESAAELKSR